MTKNQMAEAQTLVNGINGGEDKDVRRIRKEKGIVERRNVTVLTEDNKQILLG